MNEIILAKQCIRGLHRHGADKSLCRITCSAMNEFNIENNTINLLRSTFDTNIGMSAILGNKKGACSLNQTDTRSLQQAMEQAINLAASSEPDPAHDISPFQKPGEWTDGPLEPDRERMFMRFREFLDYVHTRYPKTVIENSYLRHIKTDSVLANSNDVCFKETAGAYFFVFLFSAKDGGKTSSFNYSYFYDRTLDKLFWTYSNVGQLLHQASESVVTRQLHRAFKGDIIISPDCLETFIGYITGLLEDIPLIKKTSLFAGCRGQKIASPQLTLKSMPLSKRFADRYFYTGDGFRAQNSFIIDAGVLKTYMLGLYGANKTGLPRAVNDGDCYDVAPGNVSYTEMIRSVKRGILLCRLSGGHPADNGDFSGVAKNSYYIENGKIQFPLSETMISGNLADLLKNIKNISKKRISFGDAIFPWVQVGKIHVSGK